MRWLRVTITVFGLAAVPACQMPSDLRSELCREYQWSDSEGRSGTLFLGDSGRYLFEFQGYSCIGAEVLPTYSNGRWQLVEERILLEPGISQARGDLFPIRSGTGWILVDTDSAPTVMFHLERHGAVLPGSIGEFRSAGIEVMDDETFRQWMATRVPMRPPSSHPSHPPVPPTPRPPSVTDDTVEHLSSPRR
jgi:hypothetical protein